MYPDNVWLHTQKQGSFVQSEHNQTNHQCAPPQVYENFKQCSVLCCVTNNHFGIIFQIICQKVLQLY